MRHGLTFHLLIWNITSSLKDFVFLRSISVA